MKAVKFDGLRDKLEKADGSTELAEVLKSWLIIFLAITILPALVMAAPLLSSPPAPQSWGEKGAAAQQDPTVRIEPVQSAVTVDSVTVGDFPASTGRTVIPVGPTSDNQAGRVSFGAVTVPPNVPGASGTGVLATVTLTAQGFGESPLDLQDVLMLDTHAGHETPTVEDGTVVVGGTPTATSTPTPTSTPTATGTPTVTPTSPSQKIYLPLVLKGW